MSDANLELMVKGAFARLYAAGVSARWVVCYILSDGKNVYINRKGHLRLGKSFQKSVSV